MLDSPSPNQIDPGVSGFLQPLARSSDQRPSELIQSGEAPGFIKASTTVGAGVELPKVSSPAAYYIQAIVLGHSSKSPLCKSAFLTTNVSNLEDAQVTELAPNWLIGRSSNCEIAILNPSISRHHAVIGFSLTQGFYITDVGSRNGTFVNRQRIPNLERRSITDGDLISFSQIQVEFFVSHQSTFR